MRSKDPLDATGCTAYIRASTPSAYLPTRRSHDYHDNPVSFETDRDRDADTLTHGIATIRITPERLEETPGKEADRLRQILAQRAESSHMQPNRPTTQIAHAPDDAPGSPQ